jgi:hypothetical protein
MQLPVSDDDVLLITVGNRLLPGRCACLGPGPDFLSDVRFRRFHSARLAGG